MKKYFYLATALVALAACSNEEYVGDNSPTLGENDGSIQFTYSMPNATRADIYGEAAADLLGNNFYVMGTKGSEGTNNPSTELVFDNYLVHFGLNTAGTSKSNTANWEYTGVQPGAGEYTNYDFLTSMSPDRTAAPQTIKYWDYSKDRYDFFAFSVGKGFKAKKGSSTAAGEIGVTSMKYGTGLASSAIAYTLDIPSATALGNVYITDITPVAKANYGKEVQLQFKSLGSKIRLALYETVPGYSVQAGSVEFYNADGTPINSEAVGYVAPTSTAALIIDNDTYGFATKGQLAVFFPSVGTSGSSKANYNKASANVTLVAPGGDPVKKYQEFGNLDNKAIAERNETAGSLYLGRSLPAATYAGNSAKNYYQVVFPVSAANASALTLRVNYTLVSTDGSGETIKVYGAKAVVPSTYTVWQPNYAYTYVFKISDNTNGWTSMAGGQEGLFPITFDAVVAEVKEVSGEQTTITTVSTPSITTYQQNHTKTSTPDEYSRATAKNVYVQVMKSDGTLADDLNTTTTLDDSPKDRSILYAVADGTTEAKVMDALLNRKTALSVDDVIGRNALTLTKKTISNTVATIENGVDDKAINITAGEAAMIKITGDGALAAGTYAYVYDYSDAKKVATTIYQPTVVTSDGTTIVEDGVRYVTKATLNTLNTTFDSNKTTAGEAVNYNYLYFSRSTDDGVNYSYSFYSVDGKTTVDGDLLKVEINSTNVGTGDGSSTVDTGTFVLDNYFRNAGKYAVKIIKIVA